MNLIDTSEFFSLAKDIFTKNELQRFCTNDILCKFELFTQIFTDAAAKFNLSAIRDVPGIIAKHYADCLLAEPFIPERATLLDVGCGGGFPCIPLAIARPDLHITALDSTQKKIDFVKSAAEQVGLANLDTICGRAEDLSAMRESFDVVTSRAVARLNVLSELCIPFLKIGGRLVALKGAQGTIEFEEAQNALQKLGVNEFKDICKELQSPDASETRHIILASKKCVTPARYPRRFSEIRKKPL